MDVWVAVRNTSSRKYLNDERIRFLTLDFSSQEQMASQMKGLRFDYVVHAAGITKCVDVADFHRVNTEGTRLFVEALLQTRQPLRRFVYLSSLSVCGAVNAWMNSEGHRANILNSSFNYTGIGVVKSPKYGKIYVQMFIGK